MAGDRGDDFAELRLADEAWNVLFAIGCRTLLEYCAEQVVGGAIEVAGETGRRLVRRGTAERLGRSADDSDACGPAGGASCSDRPAASRLRRSGEMFASVLAGRGDVTIIVPPFSSKASRVKRSSRET